MQLSTFGRGVFTGLVMGIGIGFSFNDINRLANSSPFLLNQLGSGGGFKDIPSSSTTAAINDFPTEARLATLLENIVTEALNRHSSTIAAAATATAATSSPQMPTSHDIANLVVKKMEASAALWPNKAAVDTPASSNTEMSSAMTKAVASAFFPVDPKTGLIRFPEHITQVIIDVGARESDYLSRQESVKDRNTAIILFDPLPDSFIPVVHRVSKLQMENRTNQWLDANYMNSVLAVRAALGETEGIISFNVGVAPACGSILEFSPKDTPHWCMSSQQKIQVPILKLGSIIDMIPATICDIHIKIDAEGADMLVLKGGGDSIKRAGSVIIECISYKTRQEMRVNQLSWTVLRDKFCN